jgi:hypothetical protein
LKLVEGQHAYLVMEPGVVEEIVVDAPCTCQGGYKFFVHKGTFRGHTCGGFLTADLQKAKEVAYQASMDSWERTLAEISNLKFKALMYLNDVLGGVDGVIVNKFVGS